MKTHSNGCKPRIAIALSGWNTSPSIRSLIAITPTIVFKSSSGESTCSELDYEIPMLYRQAWPSASSYLSKVDKPRKQQVLQATNRLHQTPTFFTVPV